MEHKRQSQNSDITGNQTSELVDFGDDTKWLLAMLGEAGCVVSADTDLKNIFHDGVALARLIGHLTGIKIRVKKRAQLPAVQLDNLTVCIKAMEEVGLGDGIVPSDFRSGNMKTVTGFLAKLRTKYPGGMEHQETLIAEAKEAENHWKSSLEEAREAGSKMRRELAEVGDTHLSTSGTLIDAHSCHHLTLITSLIVSTTHPRHH